MSNTARFEIEKRRAKNRPATPAVEKVKVLNIWTGEIDDAVRHTKDRKLFWFALNLKPDGTPDARRRPSWTGITIGGQTCWGAAYVDGRNVFADSEPDEAKALRAKWVAASEAAHNAKMALAKYWEGK